MISLEYISAVIGNGSESDPYRPSISNYNVDWSAYIATDHNGVPISETVVVIVSTEDHSIFDGDISINIRQ